MNIEEQIRSRLSDQLHPQHLEVMNESGNHSVPAGSQSHFKVVVVTDRFTGLPTLKCHRLVYSVLAEELAGPVHALALHTYTPKQWAEHVSPAPKSPVCHGGSKTIGTTKTQSA